MSGPSSPVSSGRNWSGSSTKKSRFFWFGGPRRPLFLHRLRVALDSAQAGGRDRGSQDQQGGRGDQKRGLEAAYALRDDTDVERRVRVSEDVRNEQKQGHRAGAKAGGHDVLGDGGERSRVEVEADHRQQKRGDEDGYRARVHRGEQRDRDENSAAEKARDPDLAVGCGMLEGAAGREPTPSEAADPPAEDQTDRGPQ